MSGEYVVVVVVLAMQDCCFVNQEEMKSDNNMMNDENAICITSEKNNQRVKMNNSHRHAICVIEVRFSTISSGYSLIGVGGGGIVVEWDHVVVGNVTKHNFQ